MYIVRIHTDGETYEIHGRKHKLLSGSVVQGINTIDSFTFTILPTNEGFAHLKDFKTLVEVYNTNTGLHEFLGRVLCTSAEMSESGRISKQVTCESLLGYLCDSVQEYVEEKLWSPRNLLEHIINTHNKWVESEKHFVVRTVEPIDEYRDLFVGIQRENSWETIKKKLIDVLGGELSFEVADGVIYLDYLNQIGEEKTTEIALSKNMKSIVKERDPTEFITRLIPLGTKTVGEERLTIATEENGYKIYLDDEEGIEEYGVHVGVVEYDDVTTKAQLLARAREWLAANRTIPVRYSITALDLSLLGLDIDNFERGNSHPLVNSLIGVDDVARIIKKNIDICEEVKSTIEIGDKFKTLSEIRRDQEREVVASIKVVQKVNGDYVSKTDTDQVVAMLNNSTKKVSIDGNRLEVNSDKLGLSEDGKLTAYDVDISGKFEATGTRSPATDVNVEVSVTIEDGEVRTKGTSTEHLLSGAQQIGAGTDYIYRNLGALKYVLLPWLLEFSYTQGAGYTSVGGIRSTYGSNEGNPSLVLNVLEMFGNWYLSGNMTLASGDTIVSDKNKKNSIEDLSENYSDMFDGLKPCTYKYNDGTSDRKHVGFIAQQVKEAMDAAGIDTKNFAGLCIKKNPDGTEEWSLRYSEFIALLTMELQQLKKHVKTLEEQLQQKEGD